MGAAAEPDPRALDEEQAEHLRRAHNRLRKASQDLEAFTVPRRLKGRWENAPVPPEVVAGVRAELDEAYRALWAGYAELLGWERPAP